jgi:molybdopterin synthase catalytic subunit
MKGQPFMEIVLNKPIESNQVYDLVQKHTAGSVVFHFAVVRPTTENKTTNSIEFLAKGGVNEELCTISKEIRGKWAVEDLLIIRRLGRLNVGDIISLVAVSPSHRQEAFNALHYGVNRLKEMSTVTKKETVV